MDLMKSPFTDKKRKAVLSHASKVIYGNLKIPVKKVSNSHCDLYVEDSIKANDKVKAADDPGKMLQELSR